MLSVLSNIKNIRTATARQVKDIFRKLLLCGSDDQERNNMAGKK